MCNSILSTFLLICYLVFWVGFSEFRESKTQLRMGSKTDEMKMSEFTKIEKIGEGNETAV